MNDHVWDTRALRDRSAADARPRGPGRYVGTRWRPADAIVAVRPWYPAHAGAIDPRDRNLLALHAGGAA